MKPVIPQCSAAVLALNPDLAGNLQSADGKLPLNPADEKRMARNTAKSERELEGQVEAWLTQRGYLRLTAENSERGEPARGYFGHWQLSKRNPLMLDLLILSPDGRYLMLELKRDGKAAFQPGQKALISQGYGKLATSFTDAVEIINAWITQ